MYAVTAYASHATREAHTPAAHLTFADLGDAQRWREAAPYPIVDVRNIGRPGWCPARSARDGDVRGHAFEAAFVSPGERSVTDNRCLACGGREADLYIGSTSLPRDPDVAPGGLCLRCNLTPDEHDLRDAPARCPDGGVLAR